VKICALFLMTALAGIASDGKPDFTGVWQHRESGSSVVYTIDHRDPALTIAFQSKYTAGTLLSGLSGSEDYTIDGVERTGHSGARDSWTSVNWQGPSLVILRVLKDGYRVTVIRDTWTLSPDGRTLTKSKRTINMDGVTESSQSYEKQ
jgi:hypothetical protein